MLTGSGSISAANLKEKYELNPGLLDWLGISLLKNEPDVFFPSRDAQLNYQQCFSSHEVIAVSLRLNLLLLYY